jgi:hypothetical protein
MPSTGTLTTGVADGPESKTERVSLDRTRGFKHQKYTNISSDKVNSQSDPSLAVHHVVGTESNTTSTTNMYNMYNMYNVLVRRDPGGSFAFFPCVVRFWIGRSQQRSCHVVRQAFSKFYFCVTDDAAVKKVGGRVQRMSNQSIHKAHLITVTTSVDTQDTQGTLKNSNNVRRYTRHT